MITSERIKLAAKCIKRLYALSAIKYQQLQAQKFRSNSFMRDVVILLDSSLIVCLIAIIVLGLMPSVFGLAKAEKDIVVSGNDTTLYNNGLALFKLDNYTGAIEYYDKALAINPKDVNALTDKGLALDNLGNHTGAIEYYDKALAMAIDPHDVRALTSKGLALGGLGNYTEAIKYFDKALAIDPHHIRALDNKGLALTYLGNYAGAIKYCIKYFVH
jgi:tetratricopeptide (TPR) repeat protein